MAAARDRQPAGHRLAALPQPVAAAIAGHVGSEMRARINITMLLYIAAMAMHEGAGDNAGRVDLPYVIDPGREHLLDAAEAILLRPSRIAD